MRSFFLFLCGFLSFSALSHAQNPSSASSPAPSALSAAPSAIIVSDDQKTISFMIEGQEAMRLDAGGLHVRNNIYLEGMLQNEGGDTPAVTPPPGTPSPPDSTP